MTGRRPDVTRVYDFADHFREIGVGDTWQSLPQIFKANGRITLGTGKLYHPGLPPNYDGDNSWSPEALDWNYNVTCRELDSPSLASCQGPEFNRKAFTKSLRPVQCLAGPSAVEGCRADSRIALSGRAERLFLLRVPAARARAADKLDAGADAGGGRRRAALPAALRAGEIRRTWRVWRALLLREHPVSGSEHRTANGRALSRFPPACPR